MKAKVKITEKRLDTQCAELGKLSGKVSEIAKKLQGLHGELGDTLGPLLLLEHALIDGDDGLEVRSETGSKVEFTTIGTVSGEIVGVFASKIYVLSGQLDALCSDLRNAVLTPPTA